MSKQLSYGYDVGRGYVAGEEEVRKLVDHMVDQKDIARTLKQASDNGRLDVIRCLGEYCIDRGGSHGGPEGHRTHAETGQ